MFTDEAVLKVKAGDGGNGCLAFRREKYVALGGPYGGNGGKGGDVVFVATNNKNTLLELNIQKFMKAKNGAHGEGKNKFGKDAEDLLIEVPVGTMIYDTDTNELLADLNKNEERVTIAYGGRGGRGNTAFKTKNDPAPNYAENGEPGEELTLKLELKLLADVGLVGFPNSGKSSFVRKVTNAKPKVANYPFTTLQPILGVVKKYETSFIISDIPGLIEGASLGKGLGHQFLRHIERCRVLIYLIDGTSENPLNDLKLLQKELANYSEKLNKKPFLVVINKIDILEDYKVIELKKLLDTNYAISAISGKNIDVVLDKLIELLKEIPKDDLSLNSEVAIFELKEDDISVEIVNNEFVISGKKIEKMVAMYRLDSYDGNLRFLRKLDNLGISKKLKRAGAQDGDKVKIKNFEFIYKE